MFRRKPLLALLMAALLVAALAGAATASVGREGRRAEAGSAVASKLTLLAEPSAGRAPFLRLIASARHSIELTMYELKDPTIDRALGAAARRGVDVRVLLNGGYWGDDEDRGASENGPAYRYLRGHRVQVRWSPARFALTHQKTLTVDGRVSAIMTLNFDGRYASTRDFAVLDRQGADVRAVMSVFDADWDNRQIRAGSGSGDLIWSPGATAAFESLIEGARRSLDVEDEEMDSTPVTDDLCAAARRGVDVKVVMTYASDWKSALAKLNGCGAHVRLYHGQRYYIHAKILVADGARAIVSSQNFSYTSLVENRELGIRVRDAAVLRALVRDFGADYAGA